MCRAADNIMELSRPGVGRLPRCPSLPTFYRSAPGVAPPLGTAAPARKEGVALQAVSCAVALPAILIHIADKH